MIAFFSLLRVGKYTCPTSTEKTRARQFCLKDATFWSHSAAGIRRWLPFNAPLAALMAADAVTLILSNQKNGMHDALLHHNKVDSDLFPVKALTCCLAAAHTTSNGCQKAMICQYGPGHHVVVAHHISQVLECAAIHNTLWMEGFALHHIGTHSIRASGTMQLFLNDVLVKMG
jgi:hypothetical protein